MNWWRSLSSSQRSFWLALAAPAIFTIGWFISETVFVEPSGGVRPGRQVFVWIFLFPTAMSFLAAGFTAFASLRARDPQWRWLAPAVAINLVFGFLLLVLNLLAGEM